MVHACRRRAARAEKNWKIPGVARDCDKRRRNCK